MHHIKQTVSTTVTSLCLSIKKLRGWRLYVAIGVAISFCSASSYALYRYQQSELPSQAPSSQSTKKDDGTQSREPHTQSKSNSKSEQPAASQPSQKPNVTQPSPQSSSPKNIPSSQPSNSVPNAPTQPIIPPSSSFSISVAGSPAGITLGAAFENAFIAMNQTQRQTIINQMKSAGVKWLRIDSPGDFRYEPIITMARTAGIEVILIVQDWVTPTTPTDLANLTSQSVARYKPMGVSTYEILNEVNSCISSLSAASYTSILKSSYVAAKNVSKDIRVLSAGMCPAPGSNQPYAYLQAMYDAGAKGYFDAFNMHPYSYPATPLQTELTWNPWSYLGQLRTIMVNNGDANKQIWLTEFGCPTGTDGGYPASCNDSSLASQISAAYSQARKQSWLGPLLIYNWRDDSQSGDGDFGLYYANGSPKTLSLSTFTSLANN